MVQKVKHLPPKPDDMSLIPETRAKCGKKSWSMKAVH